MTKRFHFAVDPREPLGDGRRVRQRLRQDQAASVQLLREAQEQQDLLAADGRVQAGLPEAPVIEDAGSCEDSK